MLFSRLILSLFTFLSCCAGAVVVYADGTARDDPSPVRFHVRDYGADSLSSDIRPALEAAVEDTRQINGPTEILFEPGKVYRISLPSSADIKESDTFQTQYAWHIKNATELVINGQGCTLLVTDPEIGGICIEDSSHVELKNLKIDYDPLPYTQGTVVEVNHSEYWFELKLDAGFPEPDQPNFRRAKESWGLTIRDEPNGRRRYGPTAIFAERWEKTGDRIWRFHPPRKGDGYNDQIDPLGASRLKPGDRYVHMARNWAQAVAGRNCDHILWEGITLYASPGLAFFPRGTSHHTIRDCHLKLKEGRILSTTSDGIHARGSRGHMLIEGCSFEGMADDGINIHSSAMYVIELPTPDQVLVKKHTFSVRPEDELMLVRSASASILGTVKAKTVQDEGANWLVTLDQPLQKISHADEFDSSVNFYNLSEAANPFVIRNCRFKDYRGRGILVSAHGGVIENNFFDMPEGYGVVLLYESARWAEGPFAYDLTIRNNEFHARETAHNPGIVTHLITREGLEVNSRPFHNILIEGNSFYEYGMPAVELFAARDITLRNNQVFCSDGAKRWREEYAAVKLSNCEGITIDRLAVEDCDPRQVAAVKIEADCAQNIEISNLKLDVSEICKPVIDFRIE